MNEDRNLRHSRRKTTQDFLRTRKSLMPVSLLSTDVFIMRKEYKDSCCSMFCSLIYSGWFNPCIINKSNNKTSHMANNLQMQKNALVNDFTF